MRRVFNYKAVRFLFIGFWNLEFGYDTFVTFSYTFSPQTPHRIPALIISHIASAVATYLCYKYFVFQRFRFSLKECVRFSIIHGYTLLLNALALPLLVGAAQLNYSIAEGFLLLAVSAASYLGHSRYTFRIQDPSMKTAPPPPQAQPNVRSFITLHFLVCSITVAKLCAVLAYRLALHYPPTQIQFYAWANIFVYPHKRDEFFFYALLVLELAVYYAIASVCIQSPGIRCRFEALQRRLAPPWRLGVYATILAAANLSIPTGEIGYLHHALSFFFLSRLLLLGILLYAPWQVFRIAMLPPLQRLKQWLELHLEADRAAWRLLLAVICLQILWALLPFLQGNLMMINEYWDIPESTWLSTTHRWVDNIQYISRHKLFGSERYDIRLGKTFHSGPTLPPDSSEAQEFTSKNRLELGKQILNRWVLHHHNFILAPLMEYTLNHRIENAHLQYGLLNIMILKFLLEHTGGISYQNYFRIWYAFWPLYYLMLLGALFWLFRDIRYVILVLSACFASIHWIGYDFLFLGPGLNPIRHFLDIPLLTCVCLYNDTKSNSFLAVGFILCWIAILNNKEFGLCALVALAACIAAYAREDAGFLSRGTVIIEFLGLVGGAALFGWKRLGYSAFSRYYPNGFCGFPLPEYFYPNFLLATAAGYGVCLRFLGSKHRLKLPTFFMFLYAQGMTAYYVFGGTLAHFLNIAPTLILAGALLLKLSLDLGYESWEPIVLPFATAFVLAWIYVPGAFYFYRIKQLYQETFNEHKTYFWNMPAARFQSTMDPKYFQGAVDLIQKYNPENSVYLLSKYDNFLPFLARKYSAMPAFDVPWYLMTENETRQCVERINEKNPPYLFVDTDIDQDRRNDVIRDTALFHDEAGMDGARIITWESDLRIDRLRHLTQVFEQVRSHYTLQERGMLVSVYRRETPER